MRIGVDLGGTKIEAAVLDAQGLIVARERVATPVKSAADVVEAVASLVRRVEIAAGCVGAPVGVGTPGALSPATGLLRNSNSVCLNGTALDVLLSEALGRQVPIANDANCFALSEARDGAGEGAEVVFGVILGTGVGGAVVVRGDLIRGRHAIAGEWGHTPLPWPRDDERPGPPCYCGRHGCVETWLSGPAMARDHEARTGRSASAREIAEAASRGEPASEETLTRWRERLARALAVVVDLLDPDVIVLGGGLGQIESTYAPLPAQLAEHVFSDVCTTRIVMPRWGDSSGVRGAAWLNDFAS